MHPILFSIGNFPVHTYGAILALAISLGLTFAGWLGHKKGYDGFEIADIGLWSAIIGILGARFCYVIQYADHYFSQPLEILNFRAGGITIIGALIFGNLALVWLCRKYKLSPWLCLDLYAAPLLLGMALGRLGCLMEGCCYGKKCADTFFFGIVYPAAAQLGAFHRHPVQIYELLLDLILMGVCLWFLKRQKFQGQTFWALFAGYGLIRFTTEFFRESRMLSVFSLAQWVCLLIFAVGLCGVLGRFGRPALAAPSEEDKSEGAAAESLGAAEAQGGSPKASASADSAAKG
ncbi:prolipoprotein diacylglyceryl transferase [bacterium]|nr:prolipoprotein diacylglyceryl transferase [bacterium]